jgi:DNA-directed RNA polymerase specialized sigma24 family protein
MVRSAPVLQLNTGFELLYATYAPKVLGFVKNFANSKEQADDFLIEVFTRAGKEIKDYDNNAEKKILKIVLTVYRASQKLNSLNSSLVAS